MNKEFETNLQIAKDLMAKIKENIRIFKERLKKIYEKTN